VGRHKDGVLVRGVFDVGPAHGVLDDGDVITEADGVSLAGRPLREGMAAIRGEPGTTVRLTVRKANGGEERVSLERARVAVPEG
jgi:C-terminal processing protease CtpA/Prc